MAADLAIRRSIAEDLCALDRDGYAPCPGRALHTSPDGRRDFMVRLAGVPSGHCLHGSCAEAVARFNHDLRSRIGRAEHGDGKPAPQSFGADVALEPQAPRAPKRPAYDSGKLTELAKRCPANVTPDWLAARSPVAVPNEQGVTTAVDFLEELYRPGERLLIFVRQYSQGDFLHEVGRGSFRLAAKPGIRSVRSALPAFGPGGCWWLTAPVSGEWAPNQNNLDKAGNVQLGRRHSSCVTRWPYLLLESDEAPTDLWLRALVQLPLPIVAAYTSGGRSVHALVRVNAGSKAEWDHLRDKLLVCLCPLGADPAAMSAVRLSRLPGVLRFGTRDRAGKFQRYEHPRLQRLVFLNPSATSEPIINSVRL